MQIPGAARRTDHVVATLHDDRRNVADALRVAQQLVVVPEEAAVHEVVAFDAREGQREGVLAAAGDVVGILMQETGGALPDGPCTRGLEPDTRILAGQPTMVGADEVAAFHLGNRREVMLPRIRIERAAAVLIEPLQLPAPQHEDAAQHQLGHPLGMRLRIGQRQRGAPGTAEHLPAFQCQMLAQALDVRNQVPSGVVDEFRMRRGASATALVEQHDAIGIRVEEAPALGIATAARPAMQEHHRLAVRIAALLVVQRMQRRDLQEAAVVGLDPGIKRAAFRHGLLENLAEVEP